MPFLVNCVRYCVTVLSLSGFPADFCLVTVIPWPSQREAHCDLGAPSWASIAYFPVC
jgi:hypothetical protein